MVRFLLLDPTFALALALVSALELSFSLPSVDVVIRVLLVSIALVVELPIGLFLLRLDLEGEEWGAL